MSKALDISTATAWVAPDLLKALTILSDTDVRKSAVDWEDLKPDWKSEKSPHFSLGDQHYQINKNIIRSKILEYT